MTSVQDFETLLGEAVKMHGHLCPGQVLGVRMSMVGMREVNIREPRGAERKNLIVYVETDRCATDAIQSVTGCSLGHRTMKFKDYGKMAATFLNLRTGRAVRVSAKEEARERAREYRTGEGDKYNAQVAAYRSMPEEALFSVADVAVSIRPEDMPGRPLRRVRCAACGEYVQDMREMAVNGLELCRPCAKGGYYRTAAGFLASPVMRERHNDVDVRSKVWIEIGGEPVFGRGRKFLLDAIDRYGSINRAAKEINISYRKAWSYVKTMEERLGIRLVVRRTGGKYGGGTSLTQEARDFLKSYEMMEEGIREMVDHRFKTFFGTERHEAGDV